MSKILLYSKGKNITATNTKIVKLNDNSPIFNLIKLNNLSGRQTKLFFNHKFNDTFSYKIKDNHIYIKRTDISTGWGQNLQRFISKIS